VLRGERDDCSEDAIKVVLHRDRFTCFLTGNDDRIVPLTFELWPSLSCNARCRTCTYVLNGARDNAGRSGRLVLADTDQYLVILGDVRAAGVSSVIFTGGGEPLLHPDLTLMTRRATTVGLQWGLFTNGHALTQPMLEELLDAGPRFMRISINAGGARRYEREYMLGTGSYEAIASIVATAARACATRTQRCLGISYALSGSTDAQELRQIREFVSRAMEAGSGGLASVSFRPKVLYFDRRGQAVVPQPDASGLCDLRHRIAEEVVGPLAERFGPSLRIDHKAGMFERASGDCVQASSPGAQWTSQMDHRGVGYVSSELNGSPWPRTAYGRFRGTNFNSVWFGENHRRLARDFGEGRGRVPLHHKVSHVDELLLHIRGNIGILSEAEVDTFYSKLRLPDIVQPRNWDFL
jgi:pyruvate-formate lyase-activating enzyme